jgi:hypothetical protein
MSKPKTKLFPKYVAAGLGFVVLLFAAYIGFLFWFAGEHTSGGSRNRRLRNAVQRHYREHGISYVTLDDLTNFDWDMAMYFRNTNSLFTYETLGVDFFKTDLTIGILFINDGELVYYELFPQTWRGIDFVAMVFDIRNTENGTIIYPHDVLEVTESNLLTIATLPQTNN